jgi:hypothetical protein
MKYKRHVLGLASIFAMLLSCAKAYAATAITACHTKITTSGSYVLTANLINPDNTAPCITVSAPAVSPIAAKRTGGSHRLVAGAEGIRTTGPFCGS